MLSALLASATAPAWSGAAADSLVAGSGSASDGREANPGRRLTQAELAQLRQQVRQQWLPAQETVQSAETQPPERMMPDASTKGALTAPRSQRP